MYTESKSKHAIEERSIICVLIVLGVSQSELCNLNDNLSVCNVASWRIYHQVHIYNFPIDNKWFHGEIAG